MNFAVFYENNNLFSVARSSGGYFQKQRKGMGYEKNDPLQLAQVNRSLENKGIVTHVNVARNLFSFQASENHRYATAFVLDLNEMLIPAIVRE